jgi:gas vesicle protein
MGLGIGVLIGLVVGVAGCLLFRKTGKTGKTGEPKAAAAKHKKSAAQTPARPGTLVPGNPNTKSDSYEVFDVHVARVDVERQAYVSVQWHLDDLTRDMKETKQLRQLLRLVVLGYEVPETELIHEPTLQQHFSQIHERCPHLALFLERKSLRLYVLILLEARKAAGIIPLDAPPTVIEELEQEIIAKSTQVLSTLFAEVGEIPSELLETLLPRLAEICEDLKEEAEKTAAEAAQANVAT